MKPIARDTAYFKGIRQVGQIYVDKTAILHRLVTASNGKFYFLSRPRRFGKSLMISTLGEIFRGNRALFKGLAIDSLEYDWKPYPVIQLDMSGVTARGAGAAFMEVMDARVRYCLRKTAEEYGVTVAADYGPLLFQELIGALAARSDDAQVAILIDEYDAPLSGMLDEPTRLAQVRRYLNEFYSVLKESDARIRFLMLTGVSKFTKLSIFSGLNNLRDLSMDPSCASLVGYTEAELKAHFAEYIHAFAEKEGVTDEEILRQLKKWYDGYHFSKGQTEGIYNPYSIAYSLSLQDFQNYWGTSGGATIIYERIKANRQLPVDLDEVEAYQSEFEACDMEDISLSALLYQGGYLTIAGYDRRTRLYQLQVPNDEIRETLDQGYVRKCLEFRPGFRLSTLVSPAFRALDADDLKGLMDGVVTTLYASVPPEWRMKDEAEAKRYFLMLFRLLGADVAGEVASARGKADVVLQWTNAVFILEFKFDRSVEEALRQIAERGYADPFRAEGRTVHCIGVNFSTEKRNVEWAVASPEGI